jgi:hypothetical protein
MAPEGHTLQMASISSKIMICKSLWSPTTHKNMAASTSCDTIKLQFQNLPTKALSIVDFQI